MTTERLVFPNAAGQELAARLELPDGKPRAWALFAHCFTCSKNSHAATRVSRQLALRGLAVLRFDFTGLGNSDGDFANTNFSSNVDDLVSAAQALEQRFEAPALLVGHSLGGAAVIAAAGRLPSVRAIATIGAPSEPDHVQQLLEHRVEDIERDGSATVVLGGRRFQITRQFLEDLRAHSLHDALRNLRRPLLVFHSPRDEIVDIDHAQRLHAAARQPKSFISLDGADHLLSRPEDAEFVAATLAAWAARYVGREPAASERLAHGAGALQPGEVLVTADGPAWGQRIAVREHELRADEPTSVGGADSGPTPYELLLAALGSCTAMTLQMYAKRKGWPLEHVAVRSSHDKIHAAECARCESDTGRVDRITRRLHLTGPLDDTQRARLLEIADRCPVHRTLTGEKQIVTTLDI